MKRLNRYISGQIWVGFLLVVFSLLSMLWLTQSLRFVEMVTKKGLPVKLFVELTSLLMPQLYFLISPIALFIAVLFVYNRMLADRELVIMQSAGISPFKNATGAIFMGLVLTFIGFYVQNVTIPAAEKDFRELEWEVKNNVSHLMFREGEFNNVKNMTIFIQKHEADGSVSGILVSDEHDPNKKVNLSAQKGRIVYTDDGPRIILLNGSRQEVDLNNSSFTSLAFQRYMVDLGTFGKNGIKEPSVRELKLKELLNANSNSALTDQQKRKYLVEGNRRLIVPWYNLVFALLGCTGLLIGNFNRRGQTKIISLSVALMIIIQGLDLILTNLCGKYLYFLPLLYLNCLIPLCLSVYLLLFYNPFFFVRLKNRYKAFAHEQN